MRTVGKILKETREARFYSLEEVEKVTKIRKEMLEALEADDYAKLPPITFIQGFIKNYGRFLGLDSEKLLAVFRRDFEAKKHPPVVMKSFSKPLSGNSFFNITPARLIGGVVGLIIICFFAYLWVEYRQFVGSPRLEIVTPQDQQTVEIPSVVVAGKTDPEIKVFVNNQEIGVDKEGNFKEEIKLSGSTNTITISAKNRFGQESKVDRVVVVRK